MEGNDKEPEVTPGAEGAGAEGPGSGSGTPAAGTPAPMDKAELAELRATNSRLLAENAAARKEAEGATAYVHQMMNTLNNAAEAARGGGDGGGEGRPTLKDALDENPEGVLDEHFRTRMAPIINTYATNQAALSRQAFADRMERDPERADEWKKYEKDVDEFMKTVPPDVRAQPGAYDRAYRFVLANNIDDVLKSRASRAVSAREKGAFVEAGGGSASKERRPDGLSEVEKQVARGLGLTEAEYLEWGKKDQYGA